jgi:cold-inducible RNA-binding protein
VECPNLSLVLKLEELTAMATKLYVGNLTFNTTEAQILDLFKQSGNVVSCQLIMDKATGKSKGFGFVEMGSEAEAAKAMAACNGKELDGRVLKVNEAKPREERPMKK